MTDAAPLHRLCDLAGIALSYHDGHGRPRQPSEDDLVALLAAMGLGGDSDAAIQRSILTLETESWRSPLPPVVTCRPPSDPAAIPLTLPAEVHDHPITWRLDLEAGGSLAGRFLPEDLPLVETRVLEDTLLERRLFLGLPDLPTGNHRFQLEGQDGHMSLIVAPERCHLPEALESGAQRYRGITLQLYGLRSDRNWGIGDFTDLRQIGCEAARRGADFLGINPLHARPLLAPEDVSPYAASSRLFLDPIYVDVEEAAAWLGSEGFQAEFAQPDFQADLAALRARPRVAYEEVGALKRACLLWLYQQFRQQLSSGGGRVASYSGFLSEQGPALAQFASLEAVREGRLLANVEALKDVPHAADAGFHSFLQWLAARQLEEVQHALKAEGMAVGLYRDLAVGPSERGVEAAVFAPVFGEAVSAGAPADDFSATGQCWNIGVFNPRALREAAFGPFIALLRQNLKAAGALRIDHVMGLRRLFWIPAGRDGRGGSYLSYPLEDLLAILALESARAGTLVIGEDLGTVPPGFRDVMAARGILGFRVLFYERNHEGRFHAPADYDRLAIATAATHDTATLRGFFEERDIDARREKGLLSNAEEEAALRAARQQAKAQLCELFQDLGVAHDEDPRALAAAAHRTLDRAACAMIAFQLDDLLGECDAVNLPGSGVEAGNWRRKYAISLEEIAQSPGLLALPSEGN